VDAGALGAGETRALLARHGLVPRTQLGQHFIIDPNTIRRIVADASIEPGGAVIEVGPGLGTLTRAIAAVAGPVIAIERDRGLAPVLDETLGACPNVEVVFQDAMKVAWPGLLETRGLGSACLVANLPYQISTGLLLTILETEPRIGSMTVMVQKEVGERLVAAPGDAGYGAVSVKIAALASSRITFKVSRQVFLPVPEVDSVVVRLDRRSDALPAGAERAQLWRVIDAGFAQRRKTLRRALRGGGFAPEQIDAACGVAGVDPGARAETLDLAAFERLATALT